MKEILDRTYRAKSWMEEPDFPQEKRRVLEDLVALSWDHVCGMQRRAAFEQALGELLSLGVSFALAAVDLRNLTGLNAKLGHEGANEVLREIGLGVIQEYARNNGGEAYRVGGDEFFVIFPNNDVGECEAIMLKMSRVADEVVRKRGLDKEPHTKHGGLRIGAGGIDFGCVDSVEYPDRAKMLNVADRRLDVSKMAFICSVKSKVKT